MENYSLFELEKDYYLGNYQSCINKANSMEIHEESTFYLCLSYLHLKKYDLLNHELAKSQSKSIETIGLLASYTQNENSRADIMSHLNELLEDKKLLDPKDELSRLVISSIYVREKLYPNALRVLHHLDSLPAHFATISVYLAMNRVDLADRQLKQMQSKDDYATLTLLALAQVRLVNGSAKEAYDIAKELEEKYRATPLLNNLQAAAAISMGLHDMAKQHCENALDLDNDNYEALVNMIYVLSKLKASNEIKERNFGRLKALYPNHEFVKEVERMELELVQF